MTRQNFEVYHADFNPYRSYTLGAIIRRQKGITKLCVLLKISLRNTPKTQRSHIQKH